jgi:hypothetical protein
MTDEELLGLLGEAARERAGDDARWDAFAEGALEGEALAAFLDEERARATTPEARAQLEARIEATRPLGEELGAFVERTAGAIAAAPVDAPVAPTAPTAPKAPTAPTAPTVRAWRPRVWAGAATVLAVAAAAFLFVRPAATPSYELEVSGGAMTQRGVEATTGRFHRDDHLVVVLRPTDRVDGEVRARVLSAGGDALGVPVQVSETGAVRLDVRVGELVTRPGPSEIGIEVRVGDGEPVVHPVRFEAID